MWQRWKKLKSWKQKATPKKSRGRCSFKATTPAKCDLARSTRKTASLPINEFLDLPPELLVARELPSEIPTLGDLVSALSTFSSNIATLATKSMGPPTSASKCLILQYRGSWQRCEEQYRYWSLTHTRSSGGPAPGNQFSFSHHGNFGGQAISVRGLPFPRPPCSYDGPLGLVPVRFRLPFNIFSHTRCQLKSPSTQPWYVDAERYFGDGDDTSAMPKIQSSLNQMAWHTFTVKEKRTKNDDQELDWGYATSVLMTFV